MSPAGIATRLYVPVSQMTHLASVALVSANPTQVGNGSVQSATHSPYTVGAHRSKYSGTRATLPTVMIACPQRIAPAPLPTRDNRDCISIRFGRVQQRFHPLSQP